MILITFKDDKGRSITVDDKEQVSLSRTIREDTLVHVENEYTDNLLNKIRTSIESKDSLKFRRFGRSYVNRYGENFYIFLSSTSLHIYNEPFDYSNEKRQYIYKKNLRCF